jgi:hypothetical protein
MASLLADFPPIFDGFWQALWGGIFQLAALAVVAFWVNVVYQRFRRLSEARRELIDEIDQFSVLLYSPRKIYQSLIDHANDLLGEIADAGQREARRTEMIEHTLEGLVAVIGRFRALQVKIVPLYGHHVEIFAYYLAIWRYLKEVREHIERKESLYFHREKRDDADALYKLIDVFRYTIMVEKIKRHPPRLTQPWPDVLEQMKQRGAAIYSEFFGTDVPTPPRNFWVTGVIPKEQSSVSSAVLPPDA